MEASVSINDRHWPDVLAFAWMQTTAGPSPDSRQNGSGLGMAQIAVVRSKLISTTSHCPVYGQVATRRSRDNRRVVVAVPKQKVARFEQFKVPTRSRAPGQQEREGDMHLMCGKVSPATPTQKSRQFVCAAQDLAESQVGKPKSSAALATRRGLRVAPRRSASRSASAHRYRLRRPPRAL